ncbi:helix-turn-helix domain-containing protein [Streptomyces sp. XM4011]|uniref:helix-turn-helix domain-containing protein n=1 Tax=Streptomyces sp. XM4011 TaxID=2929780 RepID=UPI001FF73229|nr:helix-turn-helix transcriptional regulator [Streptomyces sp. XM4011]MCK1813318.1 helix-turn-helix domain-containing protein [Streptomyces sp. XM4011]
MERDWARLGAELKAARVRLGMEQQEIAEATGKTRGAIANIEKGALRSVSRTVEAYAAKVGWPTERIEEILSGQGAEDPATPSDLSVRVRQALKEGPLIDSKVLRVPTAGGEVQATIVVRGQSDMSPEDLLAALREWQAREQPLHGEADGQSDS